LGGAIADSLSLLDVAIWLGQSECARLLVNAGVFQSKFATQDLEKDSITLACSICGVEIDLPSTLIEISGAKRRLAARRAFATGTMHLEQVFRQWGSHEVKATTGKRRLPVLPLVAQDAITDFLGFSKLRELCKVMMQSHMSIPHDPTLGNATVHANGDMTREQVIDAIHTEVFASTTVVPSVVREDANMTAEKLSEEETLQQENAQIAAAILRSRIEAPSLNADNVVILRLSRHSQQVTETFLKAPELEGCRMRLRESGCEMSPSWANGAKLLVPLTEDQLDEARFDDAPVALKCHHVIVLQFEVELVRAALSTIPKRERPNLRTDSNVTQTGTNLEEDVECGRCSGMHGVPDVIAEESVACEGAMDVEIVVEATFLTVLIPKDVSERSEMIESAPCGNGDSPQPANPRRWEQPP